MTAKSGTRSWLIFTLLLFWSAAIGEARPPKPQPKSPQPIVRKEWRTLTNPQKKAYIKAVKCILAKPSLNSGEPFNTTATGVISRYDDLVYTHIQQTYSIHYVGHFLAWHRLFTATYERMLRDECGYKGAQPYWDWTLDTPASQWTQSPVFDPVTGFGGNGPYVAGDPDSPFAVPGRTGGGCVQDGPFAGINDLVHLGPGESYSYNPQCLKRDFSPYFAGRYLGINQTLLTLSQSDFGWFNRFVEGGPSFEASGVHGGGHYGVGGTLGQMGDLFVSPADPIFHLHHANLDRLWWSWQKLDLAARLTDISGPLFLMDYSNASGGNATLATPLTVGVSGQDVTVGDVMDITRCGTAGALCYDYDNLYTL
ncbi:tyrosinase [Rhypophila decipiens]|uniref:Tyrosinase n=1 Tax=Rhypophila decipiens TaxID=261697 RepID=A0AAN7B366_9PEZI|nr:tyrosinase [Rhypophila decipiens]